MRRCNSCGSEVPDGQRTCSSCGAAMGGSGYGKTLNAGSNYDGGYSYGGSAAEGSGLVTGAMVLAIITVVLLVIATVVNGFMIFTATGMVSDEIDKAVSTAIAEGDGDMTLTEAIGDAADSGEGGMVIEGVDVMGLGGLLKALGWIVVVLCALPLAWCIPMTLRIAKIRRGDAYNTVGFGICVLLFCNLIGGILLLCAPKD